jgi:predicted transcriptional regulator
LQYNNKYPVGITKTEAFTQGQNEIAGLLKALAHPARVAIIEHLLKVNSCICGDLVNELPLAQATVSQHLKELKNSQIIQGTIEGTSICYCLNQDTLKKVLGYFSDTFLACCNQTKNCC